MLAQFGPSTWLAILLGSVLAVLAFLPVVAARYRRAGRLRLIDLVTLLAVATYAVALWTYTLVPLPDTDDFRCARANLRPFAFLDDIREAIAAAGRLTWRNRALLQAAFNVLLFVPLGYFLRVLARRGIVLATLAGLAISAAIEFTQRTGLWGLYHCAYRVFDVDDLMLNTAGAFLGSVLAVPVAMVLRRTRPLPVVERVTLGRRYVGMLADLMVMTGLSVGAVVGWRAIALYLLGWSVDELPPAVDQLLQFAPPFLLQGWWVLRRGHTVGEDIVQLVAVASDHPARARWLKFGFGVGGYLLLGLWSDLASLVFALITVIWAWRTDDHRGLSHSVAGMRLEFEHPLPPTTEVDR
ncbi:MAG: VanZ family protein [Propionicimonas sp.]